MTSTQNQRVIIAVVGPTGSGRSTFINAASGSNAMKVGEEDLISCTQEVASTKPFPVDGRDVVLIDTPGLDNSQGISFHDVLCQTRDHLTQRYVDLVFESLSLNYTGRLGERTLKGIIYIHGIDEKRVLRSTMNEIQEICNICDSNPKHCLVVATTMWGKVDKVTGERREEELMTNGSLLKQFSDSGVMFMRITDSNPLLVLNPVRYLLKNTKNLQPIPDGTPVGPKKKKKRSIVQVFRSLFGSSR
ncbi:hypothetical protein CPB86DRAFT_398311 [Serendipita vermifera]|nr:hypothetical protein CPB86DRAFT_398311 [Serendipita vermifera]